MLQAVVENAGTIIISLILLVIVACVIVTLVRDKKQGKSSCGSNCGCCPMSGSCHKRS